MDEQLYLMGIGMSLDEKVKKSICESCGKKKVQVLTFDSIYGDMTLCKACALLWGVTLIRWKLCWTKKRFEVRGDAGAEKKIKKVLT